MLASEYETQHQEICILADDRETMVEGLSRDLRVGGRLHPDIPNMLGVWEDVSQAFNQLMAEILIEQQPHTRSWTVPRSRAAA